MHMQCCDITYDVTVSFNDITSANKMMHFRHAASKVCLPKIAQNSRKKMSNVATVHPEHSVFHTMPHPPLRIWVCPRDWSLQPLYLSTITTTTSFITKTKIESNVFTPVLSMSRQGPPMGLWFRGCSAPPHQHAPQPCPCQ